MRVLITSFFGDPRLTNAPAQFCRTLSTWLDRAGFEVVIWTGVLAPSPASSARVPVTAVPVEAGGRWLAPWRPNPAIHNFALRELARLRPDVLVLSAWMGLGNVALAASELGIPCVLFLHDYSILCLKTWLLDADGKRCTGPESVQKCSACMSQSLGTYGVLRHTLCALPVAGPIFGRSFGRTSDNHIRITKTVEEARRFMQEIIRCSRILIAQTPRTKEILSRNGVSAERIEILLQSISTEKIVSIRGKDPRETFPVRFAYLGRWCREKGSDLLLEAFLQARLPEGTELWLIVSNPQSVTLPALPLGSGKRIRVLAGFSGAETSKLLSEVDLCVVPSRCEELASRAALEAMAHGVPVLASDSVGNSYLVQDGLNGRIFPSGSLAELQGFLEDVGRDPSQLTRWSQHLPALPSVDEWGRRIQEIIELAAHSKVPS